MRPAPPGFAGASLSPASGVLPRTPFVFRPLTRISLARMRVTIPWSVIRIRSSSSRTGTTPTTRPFRSLVRMSFTGTSFCSVSRILNGPVTT